MNHSVNNDQPLSHLIFLGALRSASGFPFEHPLELMKVEAQSTPKLSNREVINSIVGNKGLKGFGGFTNTVLTNFPRRILRESVRWPVIGFTHEQLITRFPHTFTKEGTNSKVVTGVSVAMFDSLIILPIERLIAYRVKEKKSYSEFFRKIFAQDGIGSLYRGVKVNLIYRGVVWTTLMAVNNEAKRKFDIYDKEKAHPYIRQVFTSVLIAAGLITWGLPMDFVKTRIQMDANLQKMKASSVVQTLFRQHEFFGFYAGALPVFIHTIFHATLGGFILDKIFSSNK